MCSVVCQWPAQQPQCGVLGLVSAFKQLLPALHIPANRGGVVVAARTDTCLLLLILLLLLLLQCVTKCCEKFMNVSARTGARFQEFFTEMEKQVGLVGGPVGLLGLSSSWWHCCWRH